MYNRSISSLLSTALLSLTLALAPAWAQAPKQFPSRRELGAGEDINRNCQRCSMQRLAQSQGPNQLFIQPEVR